MKRALLILALFSSLLNVSGCTHYDTQWGFAKPATLVMKPPPGPPEYEQGWLDGCESGYSGYGNSTNKQFHTWRQDPILAQNPVYYQIWKDAYWYCANYGMMTDEHGLGNWK